VLEDRLPFLGVPLSVKEAFAVQGNFPKSDLPSAAWSAESFDNISRRTRSTFRGGSVVSLIRTRFPPRRHALHLGPDLQERRAGHRGLRSGGPAEASGRHPDGRHQHQRAVHVVRVQQPPPRHHLQPIRLRQDPGRKLRSEQRIL